MNEMLNSTLLLSPRRALLSDDAADVLRFAIEASVDGEVALGTLVGIQGGAARALGSHMAVAADGRFCGYVSGGCVEAAVAAEALVAMEEGTDRVIRFGQGSPFFDIVLPCGGGITVAIHVVKNVAALRQVLENLERRLPTGLRYCPKRETLEAIKPPSRAAWIGEQFVTTYRPPTRVVISGQNVEANRVKELARASGYEAVPSERGDAILSPIDAFTAVVMLHHELEAEDVLLDTALRSSAFYIGALGSTRTHRRRVERLRDHGWSDSEIARIRAPIGSFGPTKDSTSLALSILGDIAASRLMVYG